MRKLAILFVLPFFFVSCKESIEERIAREARDFTHKNCPAEIAPGIVNDSMTWEPKERTIHYYYTMEMPQNARIDKQRVKQTMLESIKNAPNLMPYKKAGMLFRYTWRSKQKPQETLLDVVVKPEEYNKK